MLLAAASDVATTYFAAREVWRFACPHSLQKGTTIRDVLALTHALLFPCSSSRTCITRMRQRESYTRGMASWCAVRTKLSRP